MFKAISLSTYSFSDPIIHSKLHCHSLSLRKNADLFKIIWKYPPYPMLPCLCFTSFEKFGHTEQRLSLLTYIVHNGNMLLHANYTSRRFRLPSLLQISLNIRHSPRHLSFQYTQSIQQISSLE